MKLVLRLLFQLCVFNLYLGKLRLEDNIFNALTYDARVEGLCYHIVGTVIESLQLAVGVIGGGQNNNGSLLKRLGRTHNSEQLIAVHYRHYEVKHYY